MRANDHWVGKKDRPIRIKIGDDVVAPTQVKFERAWRCNLAEEVRPGDIIGIPNRGCL
jgi:hypothetical protein